MRGRLAGFGEVAERLRRSTVQVCGRLREMGSGVVLGSDGLIVTNAHVVHSSRARVKTWDGVTLDAVFTSRDPARDLALLRVSSSGLPALALADSTNAKVGELVIAVGNPLGFFGAVSTGVVHAVGPMRGLGTNSWLQADVQLAPGNSGGPLADAQGRLLGINTMVVGRLALAVPSNDVAQFLASGAATHALGVMVRPVQVVLRNKNRIGLQVKHVLAGSAAALASLLSGDILIGVDDTLFHSIADLELALLQPGAGLLHVLFLRGDRRNIRKVAVKLGLESRTAA